MTAHPSDKALRFPPAMPSAAPASHPHAHPHPTNMAPATFSKSTMHGGPPLAPSSTASARKLGLGLHPCRSSMNLSSMDFTPLNVVSRGLTKNVSMLSLSQAANDGSLNPRAIHTARASSALISQPEGLTMSLAALLQDDVYAGDNGPCGTTANKVMTVFHALEAPSISVRDYVHRLSKYAFCSPACLITAMYYMSRVVDTHENLALTSLTVHRLLITALVLACKYLDDMNYNLSYYAKVGGLPTKELANLELHMLRMLDFRLGIPVHLFNHLEATLVSRVAKLANQPRYAHQIGNAQSERAPSDSSSASSSASPPPPPAQLGVRPGLGDECAVHLANKAVALLDGDLVERFSSLLDDLESKSKRFEKSNALGTSSPASSSGDLSHVAALLYSQTINVHGDGSRAMVNSNCTGGGCGNRNNSNDSQNTCNNSNNSNSNNKGKVGFPPTSPVSDSLSRNSSTDTLAVATGGAAADEGACHHAVNGSGEAGHTEGGPRQRPAAFKVFPGNGAVDMSCIVDGQRQAQRPSGNTPPLQRDVTTYQQQRQ